MINYCLYGRAGYKVLPTPNAQITEDKDAMIHTIIFDIGNVLVDFDWSRYIHTLFTDEDMISRINNAIFASGLWPEFDRGVMDDEEIISQMIANAPELADEIRLAINRAGDCIFRLDYAIPWIQSLKKRGFKILYLSNYSHRLRVANPEALDFLSEMDGGVFSYKVKLIKPDPAIYQCICEKYALVPAETIFIDDNKDNVKAAKDFGLQTIQFVNYEDAQEKLDSKLEN